ncbi:hypothetical protein B9Z55_022615 [Caenorhabditis nigoni]|uniref:Uncharacterized protein n=2 Tax=Caenorhabditis nigoni TaxID=1611254 RepID=A0A2G5SKX5_9PELO|nr:hypothetical protein B9Z55_022615 [Caenorhabditis nigoni]
MMRDRAGYMKPKYMEEEIEEEDVSESDDDENLGEDLSVTTKSPTPSPLGSPAGLSSSYLSQEPNEFPMPKTPVKDGLPTADGTLFSAESPEHNPMVPKRRRIESPSSSEAANTQNGQSAGCSSSNGSSVADELAKPVETLVKLRLPPIPAGSPRCGPIVPKRPRIESPSSTETSTTAKSQTGLPQPVGFSSPNESTVPAGSLKTNGTTCTVESALPNTTSFTVGCAKPTKNLMAAVPQASEQIAFPAKWKEAQALIAQVSLLTETPGTKLEDIKSQLAQVLSFMNCSLPDNSKKPNDDAIALEPPISAAGISNPVGSHQGQPQIATVASPIQSSVQNGSEQANGLANVVKSPNTTGNGTPAASSAKNGLSIGSLHQIESSSPAGSLKEATVDSPIHSSVSNGSEQVPMESVKEGSRKELSEQATVASPIQSSVQNGSEQANGHAIAIGSPNTVGNGSAAASSDQNGLSIGSPHQIESSSPAESLEERSQKELSQQATVTSPIQSSVPAVSPENNEDFKRLLEKVIEGVARSDPNGSKKPNGDSVALEPPISAGLRKALSEQVTVASPIQSSVQNGSEQANSLAIVVESPNTVGNGSAAASSDQNGLSIGSPHQIESSSPAESLEEGSRKELSQESTVASPIQSSVPAVFPEENEVFKRLLESLLARSVRNGSKKPNGDSVAFEPPISAGSRKKLYQQAIVASPIQSSVQNGSEQANGLAIVVKSPIAVGNGSPAASSGQNGLSIGSPHQTETSSPAGSSEEGSRKELSQESTVASPIQSSVPAVSPVKNEDFKRLLESLLARSVPDGSKKPNGGSVALEPPISAGLRKAQSVQATVASPIQSSVQNGSEQANGLAIVVESPNATGNGSPAASSDKNGLSIVSPHQIETLSSAGSLEEATVDSPIHSSVSNGSEQVPMESVKEGSRKELSEQATVASPIQSSVQNGSEQANGHAIAIGSPNTVGNGSAAASSDQNGLSIGSPHQIESSSPAESLEERSQKELSQQATVTSPIQSSVPAVSPENNEDLKRLLEKVIEGVARSDPNGSKKPNGDSVALEPPISAGLRKALSEQVTVASPIQSSVQNGSEQANSLAIVVESPNTVGNGSAAASSDQNGLSIGSPHQIESSSPAESLEEGSRKELSQESTVASPIQSSVPAVFPEENEVFKRLLESLLARSVRNGSKKPNGDSVAFEPPISAGSRKKLYQQAIVASPIQSSVQNGSEQANGLAIVVKSPIAVGNGSPAASSGQNGLSIGSPHQTETSSPAGSSEEGSRKELSQESTVASPIQSSVPAVSPVKNEDFKRLLESLLARSVPDGSKKPNGGSVALEPPISAGLRKAQSVQATVASPIQSSVQNGSEQANGLAIVVESPNATGNGSPAASSDKNGLSIVSPHQIETLSSAGSLEEGSQKEMSQQATVASPIQSSVPAVSPENNEDFKRLLEKVIEGVARSVPNGSKKPNGDSVALEPPISAGSGKKLYQQAIVASPIQSSVQNGSKHANGLAIVVESPVTAGNGSQAASADQNVLSIGLLRQTETLSPAGSLEDGSDKWNESPVAPGLLIPATKMSVSAGSRKRPAQQDTSGSAEPNKLPNLADATSTVPNELPTTAGSKFPSFQAFSNAFVGHWNTIHSCLTRISSMVVFLPNGEPVQLGSLLPAESPSTVDRQPSPGSVAGPSAEASSASLPEPQPEENESESNDVEMEDEDN